MRTRPEGQEPGRPARHDWFREQLSVQTAVTGKLSPPQRLAAQNVDQSINAALLSGQFDVLADENRLDDWPGALSRLSGYVFQQCHHHVPTDGKPLQREIDVHLDMKFGIGPNSRLGGPDYVRLARYFAACDVLGSHGWWRYRGSGRADGSITVLRADRGGIRIHLFWEMAHMHARIAIGHVREPVRHFLFSLSDGGDLMAVDGPLPEGTALRQGEWESLQQILLALREIQLDRQQRSYQRMMDQAH